MEAQPDTVHTTGVLTEAVFQARTVAGSPALLARLVANEAALKALLTLSAAPVKFGAVRCLVKASAVVLKDSRPPALDSRPGRRHPAPHSSDEQSF